MMISFSDRNVLLNYFLPTELVEGPIMSMLRPAFSQTQQMMSPQNYKNPRPYQTVVSVSGMMRKMFSSNLEFYAKMSFLV